MKHSRYNSICTKKKSEPERPAFVLLIMFGLVYNFGHCSPDKCYTHLPGHVSDAVRKHGVAEQCGLPRSNFTKESHPA